MPNEITQKLGFEASQAVKTLTDLKTRLDQFKQSLTNVANTARKFETKMRPVVAVMRELRTASSTAQSGLKNLAPTMNQAATAAANTGKNMKEAANQVQQGAKSAGNAANNLAKNMQNAGQQGAQAGKLITLSWKTVARIVQAQIIVRGLSALIRAFTDAGRASIEFRLNIAEIKVIASDTLGSMDKISDSVKQLAIDMGKSAADVAEGLYQTISNQVTDAAHAIDFLRQAEQLALVTHAETRDAVNAMSSVMNSYSLGMEQAEHVAGTLFKTVELGRLRLNEFADILGRVTPLTAELGIQWEEVAASLATMTRQGVRVNTAVTQLRGIILKLIKPTEKMRELFKQWGVRDAEEATQKFGGLVGLLKELAQQTGGSSQEMAEYFNRVRAIAGVMGIMTDDGKLVADTLGEIEKATKSSTEAFEEYTKVPAHRIVKSINEIKIRFMELWETAQPALASILETVTKLVPNVETLQNAVKTLGVLLAGAAAAGVVFLGIAVAAGVAIGGIGIAIGLAVAALGSWIFAIFQAKSAWEQYNDTTQHLIDDFDRRQESSSKLYQKLQKEVTDTHEKEWKERTQYAWDYLSEISIVWDQMLEIVNSSIKAIRNYTDSMWDNIVKKGRESFSALTDVQKNFQQFMQRSDDRLLNLQERHHQQEYKLALENANDKKKLDLILKESKLELAKAATLAAQAGIKEDQQKQALAKAQAAETLALEALRHAKTMENHAAERKALRALQAAQKQGYEAEARFRENLKRANTEELKQWEANLEKKIGRVDELRDAWQDINEQLARQEDQQSKAATELRERRAKIEAEIYKNLFTRKDLQMAEMLGIDDAMKRFNTELISTIQRAKFDWDVEITRLQDLLNQTVFKLKGEFGEIDKDLSADAQKILGRARLPYENISDYIKDALKAHKEFSLEYKKAALERSEIDSNLYDSYQQINNLLGQLSGADFFQHLKNQPKYFKQANTEAANLYNTIKDVNEAQRRGYELQDGQIDNYTNTLNKLKESGYVQDSVLKVLEEGVRLLALRQDEVIKKKENDLKLDDERFRSGERFTKNISKLSEDYAQKVEKGGSAIDSNNKKLATSREAVTSLFEPTRQVTTELSNQTNQIDASTTSMKELTAATREQQAATAATQAPGVPGVPGAPEAPTAPVDISVQAATLETSVQGALTKAQGLNEQFITIKTSVDELVWRLLDVESTVTNSMQHVGRLNQTFGLLGESIAANYSYLNDLVNLILDAAKATEQTNAEMLNLGNGISAAVSLAHQLESAMRAVEEAAKAAAAAIAAAKAAQGGMYKGGPVTYLQSGGTPRGQDTIPAMLAPGEFVVNARSTRKFFSQLQAMNAGQNPVYREQGGSVTNIGDINVSVSQGDTARQSARDIATAIRRELRRKTSRLD